MKKIIDNVVWKVNLFFQCVIMDIKNYRLEKRIERSRRELEKVKTELRRLTGESY